MHNISHCICWKKFPAVLVGTNSLLFWFPAVLVGPISRRIDWNQCPAVLVGNFSCVIFPAVLVEINFAPYWLEPIPCCCFSPAVFVGTNFPLYTLEPTSRRICWNQFYATVFVGTIFLPKLYTPAVPSLCLADK